MFPFILTYYCIVGSSSLIVNTFIIYASINVVRGEFKWVFLGSAATNVLLSLSQVVLMPGSLHWPNSELNLIVSHNPFFANRPVFCTIVYDVFYFRQLEASVLCICLVPLNRACAVCWRSIAPTNGKTWALIAIIPNVIPFALLMLLRQFPGTSLDNFDDKFEPSALAQLEKNEVIKCTLTSQFETTRDLLQTIFFLLCPVISYPVAIVCVCKLLIFVWRSQRSVRANVSQLVIQRQKGILVTICIQSVAPLLFFSPLFVSMLFSDQKDEFHEWHSEHATHLLTAFCPLVDALATVTCLKPFRRALKFWSNGSQMDPNLQRRHSDPHMRRPPTRAKDRFEMQLPGSTEFIETQV